MPRSVVISDTGTNGRQNNNVLAIQTLVQINKYLPIAGRHGITQNLWGSYKYGSDHSKM